MISELKDILYNLQFLKPVSDFGQNLITTTIYISLAGEVVKRASGISWEDFVETRIIGPLGMTKTASSFDRLKDTTDIIDGHAEVEGRVLYGTEAGLKWIIQPEDIFSVYDLSKWVTLLLNHGWLIPDSTFSSASCAREIWSPQTIIRSHDPDEYHTHFNAYGLGFL